jgi:hypothetical protein
VAKLLPAMVGPEGVQRWLAAERSLAVIEVDGDGGGRPVAHGFGIAQGQRQCTRSSVSDGCSWWRSAALGSGTVWQGKEQRRDMAKCGFSSSMS